MYKINLSEKTKFLIKYYLLLFLRGAFFLKNYATLILNDFLTPMQVSLVVSIYSIISIIFGIPVSSLSVKLGYKKSSIISIIMYIISYVYMLYFKNIYSFSIYFGCYAIFNIIFTSAVEALIYGNIRYFNLKSFFPQYRNISRLCRLFALTMTTFFAGKMVYKNTNMLFIIDIIILIFSAIILLSIVERKTEGQKIIGKNYKKLIKNSFFYMFKNKTLRNLILFETIWSSIFSIMLTYRSLFCKQIAITGIDIGTLVSLQSFIATFLQMFLVKCFLKKGIIFPHFLFIISGIFCLFSTYYYHGIQSYIFHTIFFIFIQTADALIYPRIISIMPEKSMPVILSIINLLCEATKSIMLYAFGYLANNISYKVGFTSLIIFFIISSVIFYIIIKHDKHLIKIEKRL